MIIRNSRYKEVLPDTIAYKGQTYTKAYAKGKLLFDSTDDDYEYQYFTVESLEDGNVITFTKPSTITTSDLTSMSYSTDGGGATWTTLTNDGSTAQSLSVTLDAGDKVIWKGTANHLNNNYGSQYGCHFTSSGQKQWTVYGNIMSLLFGDNFYSHDMSDVTVGFTFYGLFNTGTSTDGYLVDAENLVIPGTCRTRTHLYSMMFKNNTGLVKAPKVLPATVGTSVCYYQMFYGCSSLVSAPEIKVTSFTGQQNCFEMFRGCSSLVTAPDLPATSLTNQCYSGMFRYCTSLENAPALSVTTLTDYCYGLMFFGCTALVEAPELPAATLTQQCYQEMFRNCTSLNYIKCLATDISASNCTTNWVNGVAATGTFVKADGMNNWTIDSVNGIPIGWTLHNYENCTVTLSVNDSSYGSTTGAGTYHTGDMVTIKANAVDGYRFVGWYDGSTLVSQNEGYTFEIWTNVSYQAVFEVGQVDYSTQYFTIESLEDNCSIIVQHKDVANDMTFYYSLDNGSTWTSYSYVDAGNKNLLLYLNSGDKALLKATCTKFNWKFAPNNKTKKHKVYGNVMSLVYGDNFQNQTTFPANTQDEVLASLFSNNEYLVSAKDLVLPATTLTGWCYASMFYGCDNLVDIPELPATTLASGCYRLMFMLCQSLVTPPALPATTLAASCYYGMFNYCMSMTTAPALPATTLANSCYEAMFQNCSELAHMPSLPATTLAKSCYKNMFAGCKKLTDNVALYATTLAENCYYYMFYRANIERLSVYAISSSWSINFGEPATTINPPVTGVYFVKPNATSNILNACPSGWTISKTL